MLPHYIPPSLFELLHFTLIIILALSTRSVAQRTSSVRNLTIPLDTPQITYTPFRCDTNDAQSSPGTCNGAWSTQRINGHATTATRGPDPATDEIIPQMFFQFRGFALFLETSQTSNATVNITVTTNSTTISAVFDSSLPSAAILNLVQSSTTTFSLTFLPDADPITSPREFGLTSMIITVPNDTLPMSSFLPTMTLPPSSSPPIFTPPSTAPSSIPTPLPPDPNANSPSSTSSARRTNIALAVGITIGLGLGLTAVAVVAYCIWKKKRHPRWVSGLTGGGGGGGGGTSGTPPAGSRLGSGSYARSNSRLGIVGSRPGSQPRSVPPGWRDNYI